MGNMSGVRSTTTMTVSVVFLLAVCSVSIVRCSLDLDLDMDVVKTESEWQFIDGDIDTFTANATAPAPVPPATSSGKTITLVNGDFEMINSTAVNDTTLVSMSGTDIPNWSPGGAGVQILVSNTYKMAVDSPSSKYCIHLNNPGASVNGTQGSIATMLAVNAVAGKTYTVHYDVARMPDGPLNLWPALRVSNIQGIEVNDWAIKQPVFNMTDSKTQITWTKQSFVYTGKGASTIIMFESMSEKYGALIDNVETLSGKHELAAAPPSKMSALSQRLAPFVTLVALTYFHSIV
ncbi:uncharacterized protein [Physcomitrium patens]|uniref:DUF642 domain-containing protein n=2 Tax=Physcomitrium patens TaxID=3218 RepID=A0A2K1L1L1_PHYPA|nr:uncharacterized protein LOC112272892 [Physcomitrium patens]XP_024356832.1 uncharacterized protein LOC112272892 [Physcomitrium patens]XP_024356837.1 uncharacterized protein LOC112272892 [Physcomitrium patens]XP_024356848.1 uncharacterized protein LOC112272892 [Physcomitrium patens]XP_024356858.1 uncharacterized protein LOC112272892 [Physcomitrium patens]XP_024356866.1 uncharacterized protein LOC112272892 [Physcomitrium patens]XP_024356876.1 uncharacterized protein LOC112272892 [Physcomitriu|eukprot:XP_024356831.1 uncharacterized protein LOC112272892 [Physcomitrella patens]